MTYILLSEACGPMCKYLLLITLTSWHLYPDLLRCHDDIELHSADFSALQGVMRITQASCLSVSKVRKYAAGSPMRTTITSDTSNRRLSKRMPMRNNSYPCLRVVCSFHQCASIVLACRLSVTICIECACVCYACMQFAFVA